MTETKSGWTTRSYIQAAMTLYGLAAIVYSIYTTMESTGIAGEIAAKQMDWFGSASFTVTFCLVMVVTGLIPAFVLMVLGVTAFPALGDAMWGPVKGAQANAAVSPIPAAARPAAAQGLAWSTIFKTAVVLLGITCAAAAVTYFINARDQALGIYKLNLDKPAGPLPGRIGFVQLTGHLARKFVTGYRDKDEMHLIVAVTEENWNPDTPARFFVQYTQFGTNQAAFATPQEFRQAGAAEFGGRFGGKLPVFAEREMEKKGLKIDKNYRILNWERIPEGGAPRSDSHLIILIIGGICSAALLAPMVGIKLKQPKQA